MTSRPRSVPPNTRVTRSSHAAAPPSDSLIAVHRTRTTIPSSSDPAHASSSSSAAASAAAGSHLVAQAEALARMTLEMNLRSVSRQANRLEQDLKTLVQSTAHDTAFRAQHESRLQDMWKEILAVKAHMAQERDTKDLADETCRREMRSAMDEIRGEIDVVRETVGGLKTAMADMPSAEQIQAALSQSSDGEAARDRRGETNSQPRTLSNTSIQQRIQEALKSTRRWNRDHKTTRLTDAVFCARYLQQQSKRDAAMAVFLQRAIQRHVQARFLGRQLRPRSLEEFCRVVQWADVKAVVERVLLADTTDVTEALKGK